MVEKKLTQQPSNLFDLFNLLAHPQPPLGFVHPETPPHPPPTEPHAATDRAEAGTVRNDDDLTTV